MQRLILLSLLMVSSFVATHATWANPELILP